MKARSMYRGVVARYIGEYEFAIIEYTDPGKLALDGLVNIRSTTKPRQVYYPNESYNGIYQDDRHLKVSVDELEIIDTKELNMICPECGKLVTPGQLRGSDNIAIRIIGEVPTLVHRNCHAYSVVQSEKNIARCKQMNEN